MQSVRGREAEERKPIAHGLTSQTVVSWSALVRTPAPGFEIMVGAKELQEALCHSLVHIEKGTQSSIESFDGTGSPVPLLQEGFDCIQERIKMGAEQIL